MSPCCEHSRSNVLKYLRLYRSGLAIDLKRLIIRAADGSQWTFPRWRTNEPKDGICDFLRILRLVRCKKLFNLVDK